MMSTVDKRKRAVVGRPVGSWVSPSKHIQEEDEDIGPDEQMSGVTSGQPFGEW